TFQKKNHHTDTVHGRSCIWLSVLVFQYCFHLSASLIYWTAYVKLRYFDRVSNETVGSICECGMSASKFRSSAMDCPDKKGNCTYSQKIQAAQREGASAVVIYNIDRIGNGTNVMAHSAMRVSLAGSPRQVVCFKVALQKIELEGLTA
uniref:PA domain-containing protein n=1 Tax=Cyprinus carpio TaxID=7962 RepID=A0A8C2JB70_CYPCA